MADESESNPSQVNSHEPWWERKLTLLVAGFILTGFIGPWLQFVQKQLEWRREIGLESFNRKLTAMQNARSELTKVYVAVTLISEDFEHTHAPKAPLATRPTSASSVALLDAARLDRIRETALLFVDADIFHDPEQIKMPLEKLVVAWKVLADTDEDMRTSAARPLDKSVSALFARAKQQFNENYDVVHHAMEAQTGEFEDANRGRSF